MNSLEAIGKIKKPILFTFLFFNFWVILPMGCGIVCLDSCGCSPSFPPQTFRIKSFEMFTADFDGQQVSSSTFLPYNRVFKAFRIKEFELLSEEKTMKLGGINAAFACSPPSPTSEKKLVDIRVLNLKQVILGDGTILEPGQNISDLFKVGSFYSTASYSIQEFLGKGRTFFLEDLHKLSITKNPGKELVLEFSITLQLEDGTTFLIPNEVLSLQPGS